MIYLAKIDDFSDDFFAISLASLPKNISEKINNILNETAQKQSILAWSILKYCLAKQYQINNFEIYYGENQKPYLKNENIYFNLSHSANYVVCAVSKSEIGIDIQKISQNKPRVAQRLFCINEQIQLEKASEKNAFFTRLWTLKESYLKMTGEGISSKANQLDFSIYTTKSFKYMNVDFEVFLQDDYFISVCSKEAVFDVKIIDELILTAISCEIKKKNFKR